MIETRLIIHFDLKEGRDKFIELMGQLAKNIPSIFQWKIEDIEVKK